MTNPRSIGGSERRRYVRAIVLLLCAPTLCLAQGVRTFLSEGTAIIAGGLPQAREEALQNALRAAVDLAIAGIAASEPTSGLTDNLRGAISNEARQYVTSYTILREGEAGGIYKVTAQATVSEDAIRARLASLRGLYRRVKQPRLMVVIPEKSLGIIVTDPSGETEVTNRLIRSGLRVVDKNAVKAIRDSDQLRKALQGDHEAAKLIGLRHGAEILIVGEAFSQGIMQGGPLGPLISARARLEARAIRTATGEILIADGQFGSGSDISGPVAEKKALADAGRKWVEANLSVVLSKWEQEVRDVTSVQLVVHVPNVRQLLQFESALRTHVPSIKDIQRRSFEGNVAVLELDVAGEGASLADELLKTVFAGLEVNVTTVTPHRLDVVVRTKQ